MVITWNGIQCFKVVFGDTVLAFNPISKNGSMKPTRFGSDLALISINHPDFNGVEQVSQGEKESFVINGPGEYEKSGIFVKGFLSKSTYGGNDRINTIYTVDLEGMNICFLGALGDTNIPKETKEALGGVDILFVPIGGEGVLSPSEAYKLAVSFEPSIIIPMHYGEVGGKDALKAFLKEAGVNPKAEDKLTIKKKDLEGKTAEIALLNHE